MSVGRTAAMLHDIGECTYPRLIDACGAVVGDIPQGRKTNEQRAIEAMVRESLYGLYFPDMPDDYIDRVEAIIAHKESSPIHHAFEAAHDVNTLRVGLRAGRAVLALTETAPGKRVEQLRVMAKAVTTASLGRIENYHASTFAYANHALNKAEPIFERIQREL